MISIDPGFEDPKVLRPSLLTCLVFGGPAQKTTKHGQILMRLYSRQSTVYSFQRGNPKSKLLLFFEMFLQASNNYRIL